MSEVTPSVSKQRFEGHAVHATLALWEEKFRSERPDNVRDLPAESREAFIRLRWLLRDLRQRLTKTDPFLAPANVLNSINKHLSQIQGPWDQYRSDPPQHWQQLDNHADGLINQMRNLPSGDGSTAWRETFEVVRAEMAESISQAQKAVQSLKASANGTDQRLQNAEAKLAELVQEIQNQKVRLDQALTQHSEAFTKAEQERTSQFSQSEQTRLAGFNDAQQARRDEFESTVNGWDEQVESTIATHKQQFEKITTTTNEESDQLIARVQEQLDKAVEIVGTIVKTTMSGNYQLIANREYRNAWIMRVVAIVAFFAMGGMIVWAASSINFGDNGVNWTTVAFRISLGIAFLIPGIYCARESGKHWSSEKHNRRIALELAALDPFLVKLDEIKRKEIIERKADEYFGRNAALEDDDIKTLKQLNVRGDQVLKIVEKIVGALRGN